jgi:hypothetical protein
MEVEALVREFEGCTLEPDSFTHPAHLAVAMFYLSRMDADAAAERVRGGLHRLLAHYGLTGYNETITLFWLRRVESFLRERGQAGERPFVELLDELIERYGASCLVFDYYTRECLMSEAARASRVEPDVKPLDF